MPSADTPINWKRNLTVTWLGCFLTGAAFSLVMPFLPLYVEQLGVTGHSAKPVVSVDTTGAGDAFVAGLLASLAAKGMPTDIEGLEPTLTLAQTCGALATTAKGAMTALPYQRDLNRQF